MILRMILPLSLKDIRAGGLGRSPARLCHPVNVTMNPEPTLHPNVIMSNTRSSTFLGGLLIGTAIGAVSGILLAPKSGKETRRIVNKSLQAMPELAEDISSNVQLQADRLSETSLRNWEATLKRLREAIAAGVVASQLEQERLRLANSDDDPSTSVTDRITQPRE